MTSNPPDKDPHREGGGDQDVIIAFSIRGDGVLYELLDDEQNIIATISMQDLVDLFVESGRSLSPNWIHRCSSFQG